jgi:hypothetical protein
VDFLYQLWFSIWTWLQSNLCRWNRTPCWLAANFDNGFFLCSFLIKFPAWFDLAFMDFEVKRSKGAKKYNKNVCFLCFVFVLQYFQLNFWKFLFQAFKQICCSFCCSSNRRLKGNNALFYWSPTLVGYNWILEPM